MAISVASLIGSVFVGLYRLALFLVARTLHYGVNGLGFGLGIVGGIVAGYFIFVYHLPTHVEVGPAVRTCVSSNNTFRCVSYSLAHSLLRARESG